MTPTVEIKELTIVLVGKFNPVIFNPQWLVRKELISELEAEESGKRPNYLNHPEISQFNLGYVDFQVLVDKVTVSSTQEAYFENIRDLVIGIFSILKETPISSMGVNSSQHFKLKDESAWRNFGDKIIPNEGFWDSLLSNPNLNRLEIQSKRTDEYKGVINIHIGLSARILPKQYGVQVQINDHYEFMSPMEKIEVPDASKAVSVLQANWENSITSAENIIKKVIGYACK